MEITNITPGTISYTVHENLLPSTKYFYRIRAYNNAGISGYSTESSATTYTSPPSSSPELRGIPVSYKEIDLRWTDVLTSSTTVNGFIGYRLESWTNNAWTEFAFAGVDDTNHFVDDLQPSTEYTFRIVALHPLASVRSTNTVRTMDPPPIPPPAAPTFFAEPHTSTSIELKWFDIHLETEYRIERENFPGGGVWQQIATLPTGATTYIDTDLQPATLYVFRIRAANSYGTSPYSDEAAAITRTSISGDIVIRAITRADTGANYRLRLAGSTGQKFKVQSTANFNSWIDRTGPLTLTSDMEVDVPSIGNSLFYRTIRVD